MNRIEAQQKMDLMISALKQNGWAQSEINAAVNGLHREDAVELLERLVERTKQAA